MAENEGSTSNIGGVQRWKAPEMAMAAAADWSRPVVLYWVQIDNDECGSTRLSDVYTDQSEALASLARLRVAQVDNVGVDCAFANAYLCSSTRYW